ncbi:MAG: hypothetical protein LBT15_02110, partial [Synergistaceae bacterium]|jgi:hypothetical protein|nr:hypothetical protein [Synergistaceae bacterium]
MSDVEFFRQKSRKPGLFYLFSFFDVSLALAAFEFGARVGRIFETLFQNDFFSRTCSQRLENAAYLELRF